MTRRIELTLAALTGAAALAFYAQSLALPTHFV
ncbi:hypothetical protein MTDSW087_04156 [Methylobacterium dankookense]|uniref:Uncharacterized protein n=1 Tax=Methylobacterium dankookense TaxID=560405 RepID=A0A564G2U5_9HYPH|nr:hypothetical protein IFDJLNFL_0551 [Methylobacterium dankookense]VUF14432.1 hypothetical protein MTDSW087_04156 [Methylobacterium dankookense]